MKHPVVFVALQGLSHLSDAAETCNCHAAPTCMSFKEGLAVGGQVSGAAHKDDVILVLK